MSYFLRLLRKRGRTRIAILLVLLLVGTGTLLALATNKAPKTESPIDLDEYAELMTNRITRLDDLISWYYDQQDNTAPLIPPGLDVLEQPGTPEVVVIDLNAKELDPSFIKALLNTTPVYRNSVPTYDLSMQETLQGTIEIRDAVDSLLYTDPAPSGYVVPYDLIFRQTQNEALYLPELARYRLKSKITLLPQACVEPYLFAQAKIDEALALTQEEEGGGGMMLLMSMEDELRISGMMRLTNGLQLELTYPESYSGQVWSAYSYDMPYCPITNIMGGGGFPDPPDTNEPPEECTNCIPGDCDIDITNTFMGLERTWTPVNSNLVLTGSTTTVWLDTRPLGVDADGHPAHRFYGLGANGIDSDNDGLNDAFELYSTKTSPETPDLDADGLTDGWEVQHGLNPLSSTGNDGSDGDPDGDGLSNAEEFQTQSNPQHADVVINVAGASAELEGRSIHLVQQKCGFTEYINASTPPKIYLVERKLDWDYCDIDLCAQALLEHSNTTYQTCDPQSGVFSGITTYVHTRVSIYEGVHCVTESWSVDGVDFGISPACDDASWDQCSITNDSVYKRQFELSGPTGGGSLDCDGWHDGQPNRLETLLKSNLENEYTTEQLLSSAADNLNQWSTGTDLAWGQQRYIAMPGPSEVTTNQAVLFASRDVRPNETNVSLRKLQYRFKTLDTTAAVYRVRWVELYHPEDTNQPSEVIRAGSTVFRGSGSGQEIYSPEFILEPPAQDGWVEPVVVKVDIVGPDKTSTWPCTCDQSKIIIGANIVPPIPNQTIEWSFVGQSFGATMTEGYSFGGNYPTPPPGAAFYATVTPGTQITGPITVRAKIASLNCYADTEILVHAVPTEIQQTMQNIQPPAHVPYVAYYKHRFQSSGGDLNNVQIWERVELAQNPFQASGFPIAYGDTPPWTLDSSGLMDEWDMIHDPWNSYLRDLNRWIPSPCHDGLPVVMSTPQSFAWKCPLCAEYNEFETHDVHTGFNAVYSLSACGSLDNPEYVIVDNGSAHYDEYQSTPVPVLESITVIPASIAANGTNTALVGVNCCWLDSPQLIPPPQQWSWAAGQDALGCSYNVLDSCTARITAGTNAGQVVIGLYADWQCNYKTATLTLTQP